MQKILVSGAGKSSIYLIQYLLSHAEENNWQIVVADASAEVIAEKTEGHPSAIPAPIDIMDDMQRQPLVREAALVISLMPPHLHLLLAKDCLQFGKHLITASYISPEMRELDAAVKEAGLMFMCEMGLDPGIDHMTATELIHRVEGLGGKLTSFKSYCGGLIAPESDDNPWHYKFSWNPRNIVVAGKAGAVYLEDGKEVNVGYDGMFKDNESIHVDGIGDLAWYPNRDSLSYLDTYHVPDAHTFLRATLRYPAFCTGWEAIAALGLTDETDKVEATTLSSWLRWKMGLGEDDSILAALRERLGRKATHQLLQQLEWLGLFSDAQLPAGATASADILLQLLLEKWSMKPTDKDLVVMQHEVHYEIGEARHTIISTMAATGEDSERTAMAKTVGLPMGILARMVLNGKVKPVAGVHVPNMPEVYVPVLAELEERGIVFREREIW